MNKYNVIIPAAGIGKRLKPLTNDRTKSMVRIFDKTIIEYQLDAIPDCIVNKLVIITGYKNIMFEKFIKGLNLHFPVKFYFNKNFRRTHCAYSLLKAKNEMKEGFIHLNSDLIFSSSNLIKLLNSKYENAVLVRNIKNFITDLEQVYIKDDLIIEWCLHTPTPNNGEVVGPIKISSSAAQKIINYFEDRPEEEQRNLPCYTLYGKLINQISFYSIIMENENWQEIDNLEDLEKAKKNIITKLNN